MPLSVTTHDIELEDFLVGRVVRGRNQVRMYGGDLPGGGACCWVHDHPPTLDSSSGYHSFEAIPRASEDSPSHPSPKASTIHWPCRTVMNKVLV